MISFNSEFTHESEPQPPTTEELIAAFTDESKDVAVVVQMYDAWLEQKKHEADIYNGEHPQLWFNTEVAEMFLEAGMYDDAHIFFHTSQEIVANEMTEFESHEAISLLARLIAIEEKIISSR
jgi:hypothetical protein